ncbi:MAG: valine--tRNA ligase [Bacteroidota bacterium]
MSTGQISPKQIPPVYSPQAVEQKWYRFWESTGSFRANADSKKRPYTIVMPPPNITGILTMGHVLNNTIQDILIRWKRMEGYEACWIPGTDHAGIATQNVVERALARQGILRKEIGREEFLKHVWKWREEYGSTITKQLRMLGISCDWVRERFTMDEGLSKAVTECFVRLYEKGLIYRGKYIINWCPKDRTAISDDEVETSETQGHLWYINYPIEGSNESITVATTRPETMLGDTAVAVHPEDERYRHLHGRTAILPLVGRRLVIIADSYVDPSFGTGAVKVTPAHDFNDFQMAGRHNLERICILDTSGRMNENVPKAYQDMDRFECRKQVIKDLEAQGCLVKTDEYVYNLGRCYRCDTIVEPYLSDQWFVRMMPLSEGALKVVQDGRVRLHPEHWKKTYENWMTNIRDWCISRQLWWGHRIPVFYCTCEGCDYMVVARSKPTEKCPKCGCTQYRQDEDVLDTWFSSWLWPISTLGWPEENKDLRYFYPTDTLVTAPDIIFFWVARMIMAGLEFMGEIPFKDVYFTSIIRDAQGRKMSKSLGNSPDPLDVIAEYGADALRFTVAYLAPLGQDVLYSNEKCKIGRNFANKIWNAGRFLLMNREQLESSRGHKLNASDSQLHDEVDLADRWILSRLESTVKSVIDTLTEFEINTATKVIYDFIWHDYCDWYLELIKDRIDPSKNGATCESVLSRAIWIFEEALKLLHPFTPFMTAELWQNLGTRAEGETILRQPYPRIDESLSDPKSEEEMGFVQEVIVAVRNIRGELDVPISKTADLVVRCHDSEKLSILERDQSYLQRLAKVGSLTAGMSVQKPAYSASAIVQGQEIFVPLKGLIDTEVERSRLEKEIARLESMLKGVETKLSKKEFIGKAPKEVVEKELDKKRDFEHNLERLRANYASLTE